MGSIYCLLFPNGKTYIGQTKRDVTKRHHQHIKDAFATYSTTYHGVVARAIRKYYPDIILDILYENVSDESLDTTERRAIMFFDYISNGYNIETGGNVGKSFSHTEETKERLRQMKLGKRLSDEHKKKISQSLQGKNHPWFNRRHSEETKRKISMNHWNERINEKSFLIFFFLDFFCDYIVK